MHTDIDVPTLLASVGGNAFPERRDELIRILDIDLDWRMHRVSDGERRRVQVCLGLVRPYEILFLDEISMDMDLLVRCEFTSFLKRETLRRPCTIVYATHIFDTSLSDWASHLVHMHLGKVKQAGPVEEFREQVEETNTENIQLGELVLKWLKEDRQERGPRKGGSSEGKTYESLEGKGGYGFEKRN